MILSAEQILEAGQQHLVKLRAEAYHIDTWKTRLTQLSTAWGLCG